MYSQFGSELKVLTLASWYDVEHLSLEIQAMRDINFSIVEQRQQVLDRLAKLHVKCPFSIDERFPIGKLFICEFLGDWDRMFMQLKSALSYKDVNLRKDDKTIITPNSQGYHDSQVAFWNVTTSMMSRLVKLDMVFDRFSLESRFDLQWTNGPNEDEDE